MQILPICFRSEDQSNPQDQEDVNNIEMGPTSKASESHSQSLDEAKKDSSTKTSKTERLKQLGYQLKLVTSDS